MTELICHRHPKVYWNREMYLKVNKELRDRTISLEENIVKLLSVISYIAVIAGRINDKKRLEKA